MYRCGHCMRLTGANRKNFYPKLPRVLIVQLERFDASFQKINSYLPTPLTLQCFCTECSSGRGSAKEHEYKLYCVIMHSGGTMSSGHYFAYTRSLNQNGINFPRDVQDSSTHGQDELCCNIKIQTPSSPTNEPIWYKCDDSIITKIPEHEFHGILLSRTEKSTITPYLLFYARNDVF